MSPKSAKDILKAAGVDTSKCFAGSAKESERVYLAFRLVYNDALQNPPPAKKKKVTSG